MLTLFTIPDATTTISDIASYSSPWFVELLIVAVVIVGILVGGMFARKLGVTALHAIKKVIGGGGRRGRGRRR